MAEKLAFPKMFRGADGRQKLGYFDEEGNPITDLRGYRVVTGGGTDYYDPTPDGTDTDEDEQDLNPDPAARAAQEERYGDGGQKERQDSAGYAYNTKEAAKAYTNANRGYINKPSWAKYASFLPGMAGTIGKAVNMGINANNVAAVNSARKAMGLDPTGVGGAIKGTLKDNQGQIARVGIGDGQYSVGFESLDKYGRTNMTPEEAMARARALGVDINELDFDKGQKKTGLISKAKEALFGVPETTEDEQTARNIAAPIGEEDGSVTVTPDKEIADREWAGVESSPNAPTSMPGNQNPSNLERSLQNRRELENIKDESLGLGLKSSLGTRVAGMPATPASTGLPAARPGTVVAGRPEFAGALPAQRESIPDVAGLSVARNAYDTSYGVSRAAINAGISGMDEGTPLGATRPANTISAQQAALPGISRNAFDTNKAVSPGMKSVKSTVNPVSGMKMAASDAPDPARFGGIASDLSPTAHQSVFSGAKPTDSAAKGMLAGKVTNTATPTGRFSNVDLSTASPAQMAALGLTNRTEQERQSIARTIAGELSPSSLKALAANDPNAQREVANMVASMENRAATAKYGSIAGALTPSQYNSLMSENMNVTNQNYGLYGTALDAAVAGYYTGVNAPTNYGITSYYNPEISDPKWGAAMVNPTIAGEHVFGGLPGDYAPGSQFEAMRDSYAKAQIGDVRGFAPSTAQLARTSPNDTSYTPGIGKGATSSPGNSVSGASRSTANKSFGSNGSRADSGIGRNDSAGAGRGSSSGGPSLGGSSKTGGSSKGGNYGGSNTSAGGGAGKAASGGVSGASRSTAGKGGASPSKSSGGVSGASRSTSGKTSGGLGAGGSAGASQRSGGLF